jgi:hypothetical protein
MTTPHRFVLVSLPFDAPPETPTTHRCVGCGLTRVDPAAKLTDDCKALSMLEQESV